MNGEVEDTLIFCEHTPIFTIGRRDSSADWISDLKDIAGEGIDVVKTNRGGRITYHGPGQLVGYFIFDINKLKLGVKEFVHKVEEACLQALAKFGIKAVRDPEHPGLWVGNDKIVALGFHISQGVSMHGFALNIDPDLSHYRHIVPCGIHGRGITSMKQILGKAPDTKAVIDALIETTPAQFGVTQLNPSKKR